MTAISTLVGFMPLLIASGAGAVSRWSLGTAVFGGMLVATVLSLIFVPILYIVIKNFEQSFLKGDNQKNKPKDRETDSNGSQKSSNYSEDDLKTRERNEPKQKNKQEQESNISN